MKTKIISCMFALILAVGAFCFPMTAFAMSDSTPPTISAWLNGDTMHVEAADSGSGVESVYVDSHRFNYLVDGAIEVNARENHDNKEQITVYAVDFAGNKSSAFTIKNPYYKAESTPATQTPSQTTPKPNPTPAPVTPAPTSRPAPSPAQSSSQPTTTPPASTPEVTPVIQPPSGGTEGSPSPEPAEPQPFTPDGTGTVMDNVTVQNGKEFFTITTDSDNVFYLIVDRDRNGENVYLLNAVTEADLAALAQAGGNSQSAIPTTPAPEVTPKPAENPEPTPEPEQPEKPAQNNTGTMIFIVIAALAAGGAGYYFKILKPKQQAAAPDDDYDDEDMEYEDDPEEMDETEADDEEYAPEADDYDDEIRQEDEE